MNWITNIKRPTIKRITPQKDIPDNFWDRCPACEKMLFHSEIKNENFVCPHCGHHFRLPAKDRFNMLFDKGEYTLIQLPKTPEDPLTFRDSKKYTDRLKEARKKTGQEDAVMIAHGLMGGKRVVVGVFDSCG